MARLESIGKGRLGKAGSMIDGTPPRPPKAPVPPKPVRQQTSTVKKRARRLRTPGLNTIGMSPLIEQSGLLR